jgi:hypothetical protein
MVQAKGLYEWKLVDKDTGLVVQEGSQWNLCTDYLLWTFITGSFGNYFYATNLWIQLSDTVPTVGVEYRRAGASTVFNLLTQQSDSGGVDFSLRSKYNAASFAPPVSPRTIATIGVGGSGNPYRFISYIVLSTPITQQTNQYLYVKYTNFFNYATGGYKSPNNHFIEYGINSQLLKGGETLFNIDGRSYNYGTPVISPFIYPVDFNKVMRNPECAIDSINPHYFNTNRNDGGAEFVTEVKRDYDVGDIIGPLGNVVFPGRKAYYSAPDSGFMNQIYGISPIPDQAPSISRVFVHPASRIAQIFSDPSYPASSQGGIVLSGIPTTKIPMVGRVKITKTGDASDLVDETFTVNPAPNKIFVSQSAWAVDDIVRFTSTDTLPDPLLPNLDYYLLDGGTNFRVSLSQGGLAVVITNTGIGTHTIIRQNTGKYSLEVQPWTWPNVYSSGPGHLNANQICMGVDIDGKAMPQILDAVYDIGEGGVGWNDEPTYMLRGQAQINDYIYSVQKSRVSGVHNVCRWPLMSLETSDALCKWGTSSLVVNGLIPDGNFLYIYTTTGIYKYNSATPTVAPSLLTIIGLIDTNISDLQKDVVTGYFWSGHSTGLSKIDMGALTATQYLNTAGQALDGLTNNEVNIQRGQLDVYNGRVTRMGDPSGGGVTAYRQGWVMDDGVGWYKISGGGIVNEWVSMGGAIRRGTNQILTFCYYYGYEISVIVTGKGTGSLTVLNTYSTGYWSNEYTVACVQLTNDVFLVTYSNDWNTSNIGSATFVWGSPPQTAAPGGLTGAWVSGRDFLSARNKVDFGNGIYGVMVGPVILAQYPPVPVKFGYPVSSWVKDDSTDILIKKTGTQALLHGVSVAFNNAVGKNWDQQFIATERFTFVYAPYKVKDNLQTVQVKARYYSCEANVSSGVPVTVPSSDPRIFHIAEQSNPDFRDMEPVDWMVDVFEGLTQYTKFVLPAETVCSVDFGTDVLTHGLNIPTGTPVRITGGYSAINGTYRPVFPLRNFGVYYAINNGSTSCKLAYTYADAIGNVPIDLKNIPAQDYNTFIQVIQPTAGTYIAGVNGVFVFSAADAGKNLTLKYLYTLYS